MTRGAVVAYVFVAAWLTACEAGVFQTAVQTPTDTGTPPPRVSRTVTIGDNFYNPNPLTVTVGTRVFWVHQETICTRCCSTRRSPSSAA